jgi:hypothetical protein
LVGGVALTAAVASLGANGLAAWLALLLIVACLLCAALVTAMLIRRALLDADRAASLAVAAMVLSGQAYSAVMLATVLPSEPVATFYGLTIAVIPGLLVALSAEASALRVPDPVLRRRQAGAALGVVVALLAGLAAAVFAAPRGDGSNVLFAMTTVPTFYATALIGSGAIVRFVR